MRFNDQLHTVLAARPETDAAIVTLWRQCVDLLAQYDQPGTDGLSPAHREGLLGRLGELRSQVTEQQRIATVVDLGARLRSPALIRFFAGDKPSVAAAAMTRARLADVLWPGIIPALGPTARGVLRGRRDLGVVARRALDAYGKADLALSGRAWATESDALHHPSDNLQALLQEKSDDKVVAGSSISALLERIQSFTASTRDRREADGSDAVATFAFDTDSSGNIVIRDAGGRDTPPALSISDLAQPGESGPDGHAVGAFRRRDAFRNARLTVAQPGPWAGEWRISAKPHFDEDSGRFQGYSGEARRPHALEVVDVSTTIHGKPLETKFNPFGAALQPDSLRQLVHELRTPLNAILGFGEIIEQQLFGPVSDDYRGFASEIVKDARRLLSTFDELDLASHMERGQAPEGDRHIIDLSTLVSEVADRFLGEGHKLQIDGLAGNDVWVPPSRADRLIHHFLRSLISVADPASTLQGALSFQNRQGQGFANLALARPTSLIGLDEPTLLDPGHDLVSECPDAPLLGIGFSLRLVRSLAAAMKGRLVVDDEYLTLQIPVTEHLQSALPEASSDAIAVEGPAQTLS